jgi:hypothetical protein
MNENYAVDPAAPVDVRELKLLLDQFGLQTGRFLSRYPQDWPWRLIERLGHVSTMERQRALDLFHRRQRCLLPAPAAPYREESTWANNAAVAAERHHAFDAVIGQRGNGFGWSSIDQVLYEDGAGLQPGQGAHVPMQASQYADIARPLLLASAEVILVDSYFTTREKSGRLCRRRWPVLLALLRAAQKSATCQSVRLVLERAQIEATAGSEPALKADLSSALAEADARGVALSCEIRESVGHGRYLLSIHGGLQFDQGFEESKGARNHVHWLSEPELRPLLTLFAPPTALGNR